MLGPDRVQRKPSRRSDNALAAGIQHQLDQPESFVENLQRATTSTRIHYLDWLRTLAVLGVVVYHALLPFADDTWFIRNAERSELLMAIVAVFQTFGLGILFLVAGASARFAFEMRSNRGFIRERSARLLVPFVVGAVVFGPPVWYLSGLHNETWSGSFLEFLPAFPGIVADHALHNVGPSPALLATIGMHLWFLVWLFTYAALGLPLFAFLSSARGRSFSNAIARLMRARGTTLLFALPVGLPILLLLAHARPGLWDWWAFGWYGVTFVIGYIIYGDRRLIAAVRRDVVITLSVALLGTAALIATGFASWASARHEYDARYFLMVGLFALTSWAWTLVLLGVGMRAKFMQRRLDAGAGEAVLPTYVLHLPIVIVISYFVVQWPLGLWLKVPINIGLGVGVTLLAVAALLRVPFLRFVTGVPATNAGAPSS